MSFWTWQSVTQRKIRTDGENRSEYFNFLYFIQSLHKWTKKVFKKACMDLQKILTDGAKWDIDGQELHQ